MLMLAILACSVPGMDPASNPLDQLGTQVAATLTALSQILPQETTTVPTLDVSPSLTPTEPPTPAILRVAYVKNNDAWIWADGGSSLQLSFTGDVRDIQISSDGQVVAYTREVAPFNQELWAINNDGTNARLLINEADFMALYGGSASDIPSGMSAYQFGWQPGTHNLYYNTKPLFEGPGSFCYDDLHRVNADSLEKQTFFPAHQGGRFFFSPDGNQLAMVTPTSISLVNADGSNLRPNLATYSSVITYSEYLYYPRPVWASDSSVLRVVIPPADPMVEPLVPSSLWIIPTDGSPAVSSGSILAMPFAWPDYAISPDLTRIGFAQPVGVPSANLRDIHLANADTSGDSVFIGGESAQFLGWLPNSTQFVFQVSSGPAVGVHVGNVGGGYTTLAVDPSTMLNITWPDSTHFLYLWRNSGIFELRYNLLGGAGSTLLDTGEIWSYDFSN
jgi:hypothetical protein